MPWIIQSLHEGPVIVNDLNLKFTKDQIRDVDLYGGRDNAERSNDLKCLIFKNYLKEVRKDAPSIDRAMPGDVGKIVDVVKQHSDEHIQRIEQKLDQHKQEMVAYKQEVLDITNKVLSEVKAFAERYPLEIRTIAEAMRNITVERASISEQRSQLVDSGESDADILAQDKLLAMKDKKLEKNLNRLGKTVSVSSDDDLEKSLKALEEIGLPVKSN